MPAKQHEDALPPRAGRKEWIGLGVIALACVLYVMDLTVLHLAVPSISADLRPSSSRARLSPWARSVTESAGAGC
jgi:hypothetical protein